MAVKKEKQPGKGPENPLTNSQGMDPRTREQRRAMPTAGEVYKANTWKYNTWRRTEHSASSQDKKFDQDESNVIINTDQKGSCLSPRQKKFPRRG